MRTLRKFLRRCCGENGSATIEFVILFPFFVVFFGSAFEASFVTMRTVMLERAVDIVTRNLRLGIGPTPTHATLKTDICNAAGVIPDCLESLHIEMSVVSTETWDLRTGAVQCVDRDEDITPAVSFTTGTDNDLMLMTVCAVFKPMIPTTGLGLRLPKINGGSYYGIISMTAFANEPNS